MLTVAINTAVRQTSGALLENGKLLAEKSWPGKKDEAEKLLPALAELLRSKKKQWSDIREVFAVNGPGPFTGLRVGVTTANALAWSTRSRIGTATVFEFLKARLRPQMSVSTALAVKAGGEYLAIVLPGSRKEKLIRAAGLPRALKKSSAKNLLVEMGPEDEKILKNMLKKEKISIKFIGIKDLKSFGKTVLELTGEKRKRARLIRPLYLQKPHITESKKEAFA